MVYNRASLFALYQWVKYALFKGKPFQSLSQVLYFTHESVGTKAYKASEIINILQTFQVNIVYIAAPVTNHDLLGCKNRLYRAGAYLLACLLGWRSIGRFMMIELHKKSTE
jgi:hypothetical protein